jgi:hypothetical protein
MEQSPQHKIRRLAHSFPTLRIAYSDLKPWDAEHLDRSACEPIAEGARHAARFVLAVWDNATEWECGRFDVIEAMAAWDPEHKAAFLEWAMAPWWA